MKTLEESCLTSLKVNTFGKCGHHLRALNSPLAKWFLRGLQVDLVVPVESLELSTHALMKIILSIIKIIFNKIIIIPYNVLQHDNLRIK